MTASQNQLETYSPKEVGALQKFRELDIEERQEVLDEKIASTEKAQTRLTDEERGLYGKTYENTFPKRKERLVTMLAILNVAQQTVDSRKKDLNDALQDNRAPEQTEADNIIQSICAKIDSSYRPLIRNICRIKEEQRSPEEYIAALERREKVYSDEALRANLGRPLNAAQATIDPKASDGKYYQKLVKDNSVRMTLEWYEKTMEKNNDEGIDSEEVLKLVNALCGTDFEKMDDAMKWLHDLHQWMPIDLALMIPLWWVTRKNKRPELDYSAGAAKDEVDEKNKQYSNLTTEQRYGVQNVPDEQNDIRGQPNDKREYECAFLSQGTKGTIIRLMVNNGSVKLGSWFSHEFFQRLVRAKEIPENKKAIESNE